MKKLIILAAALLTIGGIQAQGWKDALKKAATAAADKVTDGKLTEAALVGTWHYAKPGVKFEGDNMLAEVGGAAVESTVQKELEKAYKFAGIKSGACSFTFAEDKTLAIEIASKNLTGTYDYDAETHVVTLHLGKEKINLGSIPGHAYISGGELQLVFPVDKLVDLVSKVGSKVASFDKITTLLEQYKHIYLGFDFTK